MIKQKRILAFLLSVAMTLSLFPMSAVTALAEEPQITKAEKNITLGISALKGGQASNVYFGSYHQASFGKTQPTDGNSGVDWIKSNSATQNSNLGPYYKIEPIKWRVLSNSDGKAFLLSDKNIDVMRFQEGYNTSSDWKTNTIRSWLNGYGAESNQTWDDYTNDNFINTAFGSVERSSIADTNIENDITDKVFLLSVEEAQNTAYGFTDNKNATDTRKAFNTDYTCGGGKVNEWSKTVGSAGEWWLRSSGEKSSQSVTVEGDGKMFDRSVNSSFVAVRPAFNLNSESVLFTSNAESGKSEAVGTLSANEENTGNEYKLTVKDSARIGFIAKATEVSEDAITVLYKNAKVGQNEYISAIIVNADEEVTHYGKLAKVTSEDGTVNLDLTGITLASTDKVYVFNEKVNGDCKTDYSSDFSDIFSTVVIEGEGTEENPYLINNVKEFEHFRDSVNNGDSYTGKYIKLTADIDLTGRTWSPIGVNYSDFEGIFDGQGHTISNMKFKTAKNGYGGDDHLTYEYQGLFGIIRNGAIVRNFTVTGEITLAVDGPKYIGGAVGFAYGEALVSNVTSYVKITDGGTAYSDITDIGGVVGRIGNDHNGDTNGYVDWCRYYGEINVNTAFKVGGIVGCAIKNSSVTNSVNCGAVGWNYIGHIGGVVGSTEDEVLVKNCANYGNVSAYCHNCIGGIVGYAQKATITNCLNGGNISGQPKTGDTANSAAYIGGILGYHNYSSFKGITNCFNYGKITATNNNYTYTGAIAGWSRNATGGANIKDNYYLDSSLAGSAQKASGSGTVGTNTSVTPIRALSGEIAYKMQEYITDNEQVWGQKLSGENYEEYPKIGGEKVYYGVMCNGMETYANEIKTEHSYSNGVCQNCGASETISKNTDGYYEIGNKSEYIRFTNLVNTNGEKEVLNAVLTADIDLSGYDYVPIGKNGSRFIGTFDGNGHKIENLTITAKNSYMGMFGRTSGATVKSFTVSGNITAVCNGLEVLGGVIGQADNTSVSEVISNVYFKDNGKIEHIYRAGGIMAVATNGTTVINCEYSGKVNLHFGSTMAGIAGDVYGSTKENPIVIKNCVNKGHMNFDISRRVAGIVGWNDTYTTVSQCANYGSIIIKESDRINQAAGIVGANINALTVEDCANYGTIQDGKANSSLGGIVGYIEVKESARADFGGVKNCFNYGTVINTNENGSTYWGNLIGFMHKDNEALKDKITNNYYFDYTVTPLVSGTEGIALTATEKSSKQIASGELAYALQGAREENVWGQTLTGNNKIIFPVLGGDRVHKVTFMYSGEIYATKYANETGVGELPENPSGYFLKWHLGETPDSAEFTATTPVNSDMTVYGFKTKEIKSAQIEILLNETVAIDLRDYLSSANGNDFVFSINSGTLPQGLKISDDGHTIVGKADTICRSTVEFNVTGDIGSDGGTLTIDFNVTVRFSGDGTEKNPYLITSVEEFKNFRDIVNEGTEYSGEYFKLTTDLNLEGSEKNQWTPIGKNLRGNFKGNFKGTFDGDGHKITGLYINNTSDYQGLFGKVVGGTVKNLCVDGTVKGGEYVGGVVGDTDGTIENCFNIGNVNGYNCIGGVVGFNNGIVKNCYNMGNIDGTYYIGGVVGRINNREGVIVENCYNTGSVSGTSDVGGVVGTSGEKATIKNCYNTGIVSATNSVGGVVGISNDGEVSNCYYLNTCEAEGTTFTSSLGTVLTAEQMKESSSFENWDFANVWVMKSDRPILRNNPEQLFEIKSVGADGAKANVAMLILKAGTYTAVFADYENGGLNKVDIVTFTVSAERLGENTITSSTDITLAKGDKVMLWNGISAMTPSCNAYEIK